MSPSFWPVAQSTGLGIGERASTFSSLILRRFVASIKTAAGCVSKWASLTDSIIWDSLKWSHTVNEGFQQKCAFFVAISLLQSENLLGESKWPEVTWQLFWSLPTPTSNKKHTPPLSRKALVWKVSPGPCDISVDDYGIPQTGERHTLLNPPDLFTANMHFMKFRWCPMIFHWFRRGLKPWIINFFTSLGWILEAHPPNRCYWMVQNTHMMPPLSQRNKETHFSRSLCGWSSYPHIWK